MTAPAIPPVGPDVPRPLWSVMIPTHRPNPALLLETLDSVQASGLPRDSDIVLVDDATPEEEFRAWSREVQARGIVVHRNAEPTGLPGNWNRCVVLARGRYVHLLHQDDRVRPGFHAALAAGLDSSPDIGAAFCQTRFIDSAGRWLRDGHIPDRPAGLLQDWIHLVFVHLAIQCPAIAVRRSVFERLGGFDPDFPYCSDYDMWQRIAAEYPIWYEPRALAEYRCHAANASARLFEPARRRRERAACARRHLTRLPVVVREEARRSIRLYSLELALREARETSEWTHRLRALVGLLARAHPGDAWRLRFSRYPPLLPSRAPVRQHNARAPRLLLITEFFPADPDRTIFGVYQRLRRTLEAMNRVGPVDVIFLWPENHQLSDADIARRRQDISARWPFAGRCFMFSPRSGPDYEGPRHPFRVAGWMLRGGVSFFDPRPSIRTVHRPLADGVRAALRECQPDLVVLHRTGALAPILRCGGPMPPLVVDFDDVDHVKLERLAGLNGVPPPSARLRLWTAVARRAARVALRRARVALACSEHDRRELLGLEPTARIEVLPNSASFSDPLPPAGGPIALFVGIAHYPPNAESVRRLLEHIWPTVRKTVPDAQLVIIGEGSTQYSSSRESEGIIVRDFVERLDDAYREARLALCPITRGSGTRVKIIEAAFRARPVVSTSIGAEGLDFEPGREILIADPPDEFARACATLLADPARSAAIGSAARARAIERYHPDRVTDRLVDILRGALEHAPRS